MILLTDPGDIVVLPDPCFATYRLAARFAQLNVIDAPLEGKSGYQFDIEGLRRLFSVEAKIKLMIVDSPSNPLGIAHSESEIQDLAAICLEFGVSLVVDETYRNLVYDESRGNTYDAQGVTWIYSLSKDAGAPGLRIGSVVGHPSLISKLGEFNSMFFSCLPKHIQLSTAEFLSSGNDSIEEIKSRYQGRLERATSMLSATGALVPVVPNSSIYCFVDIGATGLLGEEFATELLVSENVAVCPGLGFGPSGTSYIRISVSGAEEDLFEGLERIIRFAASKS
jgi:aspartate/methionine/tyrosine aminotransferase